MFANVRPRVLRFVNVSIGLITFLGTLSLTFAASGNVVTSLSSVNSADVFCGIAPPSFRVDPVVLPPHESPMTVNISIANFAFDPPDLTINVGDTVMWTNNDGTSHSTTSDTAIWDSGLFGPGQTFSFTFTSAGAFSYHCSRHPLSMMASITVAAASPTPTPAISGTITYGNAIGNPNPRFVSNVLLSGVGSPNVSTSTGFPGGTYMLMGFGASSYTVTPTKTGGVNGISSFDAAKIAQHVSGTSTLIGNQLIVADVSGNGIVSSFDAGLIAKYVAATPPFGIAGTWRFVPVNKSYAAVTANVTGEDFVALLMGEVSGNWTNTTSAR